jgi:hypothetical protein
LSNLFDNAAYPDGVPAKLVAGNRWAWTASALTADYPTASYTLKYRLSLQSEGGGVVTIAAGKVSSAHVVEVGSTTSKTYQPGDYFWQAIIIRDSDDEEVTVDSGMTHVAPNFGDEPGDTRSHTYKVLMAIRACIEGSATREDESYTIAGRSLARRSLKDLMELEQSYMKRYQQEQDQLARDAGKSVSRRVLIKMSA